MRVAVCGGREFADRERVFDVLDRLHFVRAGGVISLLVHGACGLDRDREWEALDRLRGVDRFADQWAAYRGVPVLRRPARWARFGDQAGPMRNRQILRMRLDVVLAFPGGPGTEDMVRAAEEAGTRVMRVRK